MAGDALGAILAVLFGAILAVLFSIAFAGGMQTPPPPTAREAPSG